MGGSQSCTGGMTEQPKSDAETPEQPKSLAVQDDDTDPAAVIPLEAARAHLRHWWREPVAGLIAVGIGVYDSWFYGHDQGLSSSLDEILVIGGIVLMAGSKRLFGGPPTLIEGTKEKK
jgi:hypothetical protein